MKAFSFSIAILKKIAQFDIDPSLMDAALGMVCF